jgi:hypothetical protein
MNRQQARPVFNVGMLRMAADAMKMLWMHYEMS